jgi:hypothetical protein
MANCRLCGGAFEARRWMVLASWTSFFVLLSLTLSVTLVISFPLICVMMGWEWWIGLAAAGALIVPIVKVGGRLGTSIGSAVANKCGFAVGQ